MLLRQLTDLNGISGAEGPVRDFLKEQAAPLADKLYVDSAGNLIAFKKGTAAKQPERPVMVAAHMDEVGFIVRSIGDNGRIRFVNVGGIDFRILPGQHVTVEGNPGVIGLKPIHMQSAEDRRKAVTAEELYVDCGFADADEAAAAGVEIGSYIAFTNNYLELGEGCIEAKALDDRVGCDIMLRLLEGNYKSDIYFVFSTKEEIGGDGAGVAARALNPRACLVLEGTTCSDVPEVSAWKKSTLLGQGPAITQMDLRMIANHKLNDFIIRTAEEHDLQYQFKTTVSGGTDGGKIHTIGTGIATSVISVPTRYIHSPVSVAKVSDIQATEALAKQVLLRIHEFERG